MKYIFVFLCAGICAICVYLLITQHKLSIAPLIHSPVTITTKTPATKIENGGAIYTAGQPIVLQTTIDTGTTDIFTVKLVKKLVREEIVRTSSISSGIGYTQDHIITNSDFPLASGVYALVVCDKTGKELTRFAFTIK